MSASARKLEKGKEAIYHCPSLLEEGQWHHVAVVLNKTVLQGCMASLHIDEKSQRVRYLCNLLQTSKLKKRD